MDQRVELRRPLPGGSVRHHPLVLPQPLIDTWFELLPARQAETLRRMHETVMAALPSLVPGVKWGNLVYLRDGRVALALTPHRQAVHLQLVSAVLPAHRRQRVARGPDPRVYRQRLSQPVDADGLIRLLRALWAPSPWLRRG